MNQGTKSEALQKALKCGHPIRLDLGGAIHKQDGFFSIDRRPLPGLDLVWDLHDVPYPLPDESVMTMLASHVWEHLFPWKMNEIMDECWRLLVPYGQLLLVMPYPGSPGHWQDPTHIKPWNETTPHYYDPDCGHSNCQLYDIYRPRPWKIERCEWHAVGNIEVIMAKRALR